MKTVAFNKPMSADRWVGETVPEQKPANTEPMKRLTIDIPASLHRRMKSDCASEGVKMADLLREMLETRFPAKS